MRGAARLTATRDLPRVRDIDWNDKKYVRAGVIPAVEQNGILFFAFGVDDAAGELGDFGGHREAFDRDALDAAIREYREEALNVFGEITRDSVQDAVALEGNDTVEILLLATPPFYRYTEEFHRMVGENTEHEVQSVVWLSRKQLLKAIDNQEFTFAGTKLYRMYDRIAQTFRRNRDPILRL